MQLSALKLDAEFIRGFERIGCRNLPVDQLVRLKGIGAAPRPRRR